MNIPLSLYIHFPWCVKKCPYCDFNSHTLKETLPEEDYILALLKNLEMTKDYIQDRPISSIFMGGGTPSLFSASAMAKLLDSIAKKVRLRSDVEITIEANPGTVLQQQFKGYFAAGINRVSLGIQSFNDKHLQNLGRIHSSLHAKNAVEAAKAAGFKHINLDLMFGLSEQTPQEGLADLEQAIQLLPSHLSWYELTIEPNTFFWHHPPTLPEEENILTLQSEGQALLAGNGFLQYEVSAYTRDVPCRHNVNYWEFGDYLAIGAGSHGKITLETEKTVLRYHHFRSPKQYMDITQGFLQGKQLIPSDQLAFEFMLNALRLRNGVSTDSFAKRTFQSFEQILPLLETAQQKGWIEDFSHTIRTTPKGYQFLNNVISLFLPEHAN